MSGSDTSLVYASRRMHPDGRHPPLRSLLHRTLLHLLRDLREPVLLPLRVPVPSVRDLSNLLLADLYRYGLFSAVWRGLPLVVEVRDFYIL